MRDTKMHQWCIPCNANGGKCRCRRFTHRDLVAFAEDRVNLKKSEVDDQRAQVNRLRDRIENKIATTPGYGFVKALHAGSVAKGTALRNANDRDLAVYVKAEQAPEETPKLVNWVRDLVAEAYPAMSEDQIVATTNCVNVRFSGTGLDVDVVPVLYEGESDDIGYLVSKDDGTKLRTSVRQHLDFIRSRKKVHPKHLAQLIRFTKWWARQQRRDSEFKCKSFMLELLWVYLADSGMDLSDYAIALERFFAFIANGGLDGQIAFTDFHPASELPAPGSAPIQILDPVWGAISARDDKSHKLWTDDYLAAFAQASDATLTTLDRKVPARYPSVQVELLLP